MRDLEYEKEQEDERDRRRKKAKEQLEKAKKEKAEKEKKRREKAEATIREQAKKLQWILKENQMMHPGEFNLYKPGTSDHMKVTVFDDGVVRVDTPGVISPQNHPSADAFMGNLKDILKGKWVTVKKYLTNAAISGHSHTHAHGHTHTH